VWIEAGQRQFGVSHEDDIAILEALLSNSLPVDERAIGAVEVNQKTLGRIDLHAKVIARKMDIIDEPELCEVRSSGEQSLMLIELKFSPHMRAGGDSQPNSGDGQSRDARCGEWDRRHRRNSVVAADQLALHIKQRRQPCFTISLGSIQQKLFDTRLASRQPRRFKPVAGRVNLAQRFDRAGEGTHGGGFFTGNVTGNADVSPRRFPTADVCRHEILTNWERFWLLE